MADDHLSDLGSGTPEVTIKPSLLGEVGSTGLRRWGGYVDEEFLPQLKGAKAVRVFKEMSLNDPVVGAVLFSVEQLLRQVSWSVESASNSWDDLLAAMFVEECKDDMSHTWDEFISEVLSMLVHGWSWHEVVYKRRLGDSRNPRFRSKFNDGRIGWRKMPIRAQETFDRWYFDADGGIQAMGQNAPPDYKQVALPIGKSLLFRTSTRKGNPEGKSILRNAYRPWYFKKKIEEIEAIGIERDLAGLPVAYIPAELLHPNATDDEKAIANAFKTMVRNVRRDQQEGIVLPMDFDQDTGEPLYKFELLNSGGGRSLNVDGTIQRYEQRIAMTILADFILLGHEQVGSYALATSKTGIFRTALNAWAESIADIINRYAIPKLFELNGWKVTQHPKIVPGEVDPPDLNELGGFISSMTASGMNLFPDYELENFIRRSAKLPEKSEEEWNADQAQAMQREQMFAAMQPDPFAQPDESGEQPNFSGEETQR